MSVDNPTDAGMTAGDGSSQPSQTTGASEPLEASTGLTESTASSTEGQEADSATPDSGAEPLTTADTTLQSAEPTMAQAQNKPDPAMLEKRWKDATRWANEAHQERLKLRQQLDAYKDIKPDEISQWRKAQEEAQQKNLAKWDPRNPASAKFNSALVRYDAYSKAMQAAQTPEQKEVIRQTLGSQFQQDEIADIEAWETHKRDFVHKLAADPAGTIDDRARSIAREEFQQLVHQWQAHQSAEAQVDKDFGTELKPILANQQYREMFSGLLNSGVPYEVAKQHVDMKAKLDAMQSRISGADKATAAVTEQQRLLKGNASVTRDPKTSTQVDPVLVAKERGIRPGTPAYGELLMELRETGLI